ncbi:hypothetical protein K1X76_04930 [bacterium]|nr:hypothetical protein [bacterium]
MGTCDGNMGLRLEGYSIAPGFRGTYGMSCDADLGSGDKSGKFKFILNGEGRYGFPQPVFTANNGDEINGGSFTSKPRYKSKEGDWRLVRDFEFRFGTPLLGKKKQASFAFSFGAYDPVVTLYGRFPGMEKLMPRSGAYIDRPVNVEGRGELGGYITYNRSLDNLDYGAFALLMNGRLDSKMFLGFSAAPGDDGRVTTWHTPNGPNPFLSKRIQFTPAAYIHFHTDPFELMFMGAVSVNAGHDPAAPEDNPSAERNLVNPRVNLGARWGKFIATYDLSILSDSSPAFPALTFGNRLELTTQDFKGKDKLSWLSGRPYLTFNDVRNPNGYAFDQGSVVFTNSNDTAVVNSDDILADGEEPGQVEVPGKSGSTLTFGGEVQAKVPMGDGNVTFRVTPELQLNWDSRFGKRTIAGGGVAGRVDFNFK